jgi:FkbM family methyltransferase
MGINLKNISYLALTRYLQLLSEEKISKEISTAIGINQNDLDLLNQRFRINAHKVFEPPILDICIDILAIKNKLNIIQIGANDGKTLDPIYKKNLEHGEKILLVEPQKIYNEVLINNYSNFKGELNIENVAIGDGRGELEFYILKEEYWDEYKNKFGREANSLFSFNKKLLSDLLAPRLGINFSEIDNYITTLDVDIVTLGSLIKKYNFNEIDLLQIDAEGYDFKIINSLRDVKPKLINFESFRLSTEEWNSFKIFCEVNGYGFIQGTMDTLAILGSEVKYELYKIGTEDKLRDQFLQIVRQSKSQ